MFSSRRDAWEDPQADARQAEDFRQHMDLKQLSALQWQFILRQASSIWNHRKSFAKEELGNGSVLKVLPGGGTGSATDKKLG